MDISDLRPPVADGPWPNFTHHPPISTEGVAGARTWTGLTYAFVSGFRPLVLDLYVPDQATGPVPLVVWIHGGGWIEGDRRYLPLQWPQQMVFEKVIAAGMAVATVDYRLLGEAPFPGCVQDVAAAVRYLRQYADELGIDPERVGIWGESAGAHLAAMIAFLGSRAAGSPDTTRLLGDLGVGSGRCDTQSAVVFYGPAELDWVAAQVSEGEAIDAVGGDPSLTNDLSPLTQVHPDIPPTLLMHGRADGMVPVSQSEQLRHALLAAGVDSRLEVTEGADHCFIGTPIEPHLDRAVTFLGQHLDPMPGTA